MKFETLYDGVILAGAIGLMYGGLYMEDNFTQLYGIITLMAVYLKVGLKNEE